MDVESLTLALGAGLVAALNPCGFALLPAYLALFVLDERPSRVVAVGRALKATAAMTAGFVTVFGIFGLLVAPVSSSVQRYLPVFTVVLGLAIATAGAWVVAGSRLPALPLRGGSQRPLTAGVWSMTGFGASYAVASLGCTIAPFLAVVVTTFRVDSVVDGATLFLAYAVGMGLVVATASVSVAVARDGLIGRVRRLGPSLARGGGALLLAAGAYVAWYGVWELRVLYGGAGSDPVVDGAAHVQRFLSGTAGSVGVIGFLVALIGVVLAGHLWRRRRRPAEESIDKEAR